MTSPPTFDLSPTLSLMAMGLVLAIGPLAWVWLRNRSAPTTQRLRALTWVTLFLTFDLVIFGAFTRLTDSGLGCPDWPGCYGHASPIGALAHIDAAQSALPSGPVTRPKAWIEMIHRYLATGVGVLILTLAVVTWLAYWAEKKAQKAEKAEKARQSASTDPFHSTLPIHPGWATLTLVWVCLQGAFGALTVTMKLFPAIVTLHLLGGMALLSLLTFQAARYQQAVGAAPAPGPGVAATLRPWLWLAFAVLWVQIALGGWVSTNYAVLACTEFPGCQGSMWPEMRFAEGFTLWRKLGAAGVGSTGENLSFQALTAIHYAHRLWAYVVFAVLLGAAAVLLKTPVGAVGSLGRTLGLWLAGLTLLQLATGLGNVLLGWPLLAAVMHTGGAAALVVVLTQLLSLPRAAAHAATHPRKLLGTASAGA